MARMPRIVNPQTSARFGRACACLHEKTMAHDGQSTRARSTRCHRKVASRIVASPGSCASPTSEENSLSTKLPRAVMRMPATLCRCMRRPMCRPIGVRRPMRRPIGLCRPIGVRRPIGIRRSLVMRRPIGMMRRSIGMRRRRSICLRRSGNGREDQSCDRHRKYRSNHVVLP
jgi:hypothetical protein